MPSDSSTARPLDLSPLVHRDEKVYFGISVVISLALYIVLASAILGGGPLSGTLLTYLIFGIVAYFVLHGLHLGHVRGNGIRVSSSQFPQLHAVAEQHSRRLGIEETPAIFVLQSGGVLNAFATRFLGRNFVIIYSDVLALATQKGEKAVSFIVGHELGHVKRKHMTRRALLYPAMIFPFLGSAYSRACEYTCDRFGNALEPEGGIDGLLVLAAGRDLYTQVNSTEYMKQRETEDGFFVQYAEIISTHPNLPKRVAALNAVRLRESAPSRSPVRDPATLGQPGNVPTS
jgi:Zn-dependent protease with chaperone function